ncbi:Ferrous iron transport protein B/50S ribosome-binding GTPase, putative [Leishmania lindenbergi]|uniref:Ferrous iron transport protein B/50S ribosome-binding GTPase n=1 Tax=Leishmania lindenbergi TaxID=651832 RepID=A0AAW3AAI0_9TRYP
MLTRSLVCRTSLQSRRRWEQRIVSVLSESKEEAVDAVAKRFQRVYKERRYTPVEEVFPPLAAATGAAAAPGPNSSIAKAGIDSVQQPANPLVLRAAFLGPQNAGKTSLVNSLVLSNVGAVSNRYGSTKDWTKAVATVHDTQLLLLDTPGIVPRDTQRTRRKFASGTAKAYDALFVADLVVLALPVGVGFVEKEHKVVAREVVRRAAGRELPVVIAMTMMDKVQTPRHRELYFAMRTDLEFLGLPTAATHEVSVKGGSGLVELKDCLCQYARPGAWEHYRRETTDLNLPQRVAELLRQTFMELLPHEIPHCMRHRVLGWTRKESGTTEVVVEVFFDRPAYMFTFYGRLEAICLRAQQVTQRELAPERFRFVFQAFIAPGGLSNA